MRRYSTSIFRLCLLATLLVAVVLIASKGLAQSTAPAAPAQVAPARAAPVQIAPAPVPAAPAPEVVRLNLVQLILGHLDFVFYTIFFLSVAGLALIINGFIRNRQRVFLPKQTTEKIRSLSFLSKALCPALKRAPSFSAMKEAMETAISDATADQFRQIEYLNIIGNLGPLLGLLGTVLGMIEAFQAVHQAQGQANAAQLAAGISTALTHTFLGLMLAVPCLAAFGVLRTTVDRLTNRGAQLAEDMLLLIKTQETARPTSAEPAEALAG
jgi:biopolymer transport protein ExbB